MKKVDRHGSLEQPAPGRREREADDGGPTAGHAQFRVSNVVVLPSGESDSEGHERLAA